MLTHAELSAYVADLDDSEMVDLDDSELVEFAARVTAWRLAMQGTEYDESRELVIRALAAVSNGFAERRWNWPTHESQGIPPASPWGRAHARARVLRADLTAERARAQIVAWARTVRLVAA